MIIFLLLIILIFLKYQDEKTNIEEQHKLDFFTHTLKGKLEKVKGGYEVSFVDIYDDHKEIIVNNKSEVYKLQEEEKKKLAEKIKFYPDKDLENLFKRIIW